MKNFISKEEGVWEEVVPTPKVKKANTTVTEPENIQAPVNPLASEQDAVVLQEKYLANKPKLKEGDEYKLLVCNISIDGDKVAYGLIVAHVNKKYTRVEFK